MNTARSIYNETPPPKGFSGRIACLWTQEIEGEGIYSHSVLPDGCVDIIWIGQSAPIVAGPATRQITVNLPSHTHLTGIRFRPGWAARALGVPVDEIRNQDMLLDDLWQKDTAKITDHLFKSNTRRERLESVRNNLPALFADIPGADKTVRFCVRWLVDHPTGQVGELARLIGLSERQLQRRFCAEIGYPPKMFQRIMRLQKLLDMASAKASLATLAMDAGFSDQAHMCREVRTLTGKSPHALLQKTAISTVSDLFNT